MKKSDNSSSEMLQKRMLAGSRLLALTEDESVHERLLDNQIHSALQVSRMTEEHFVRDYGHRLKMSEKGLRAMHRNAVRKHIQLMHAAANLKTTVGSGAYMSSLGNTLGTDAAKYFEKLPDYEELFGTRDFCDCDQCKSIFGPAAYFVDLMRIIDQCITSVNEIPEDMTLGNRRPDLEVLPLTCSNTNDTVPYVQIINERLYNGAAGFMGGDPWESMASMKYPFNQPVFLPLEQIRITLRQVGTTLEDVYRAWKLEDTVVWRERAGLSAEEFRMLTAAGTQAELSEYFGLAGEGELPSLADPEIFLERTQLTPAELQSLLTQNLSQAEIKAGMAEELYINQGLKQGEWMQIADGKIRYINEEQSTGLSRLNRLIRLSTRLGLSYDVLDWLLTALSGTSGPIPEEIAPEVLMELSKIMELSGSLRISPVELTSLLGNMKLYGKDLDGMNHFDFVFNHTILYRKKTYRPDREAVLEWNPAQDQELTDYLCACLEMLEKELLQVKELYMGKDNVLLSVENLSLLYRQSKMLQLLQMNGEQYAIFMKLMGKAGQKVFTADELSDIFRLNAVMQSSGCHIYQMDYFLRGTQNSYVASLCPEQVLDGLMAYLHSRGYTSQTEDVADKVLEDISIYMNLPSNMLKAVIHIAAGACAPLPVDCWAKLFITFTEAGESRYRQEVQQFMEIISRWISFARIGGLTGEMLCSIAMYPQQYGMDGSFACSITCAGDLLRWGVMAGSLKGRDGSIFRAVEERQMGNMEAAAEYLAEAAGWQAEDILWLMSYIGDVSVVTWIGDIGRCIGIMSKTGAGQHTIERLLSVSQASAPDYESVQQTADHVTGGLKKVYGSLWDQVSQTLQQKFQGMKRDGLLDIVRVHLGRKYEGIRTYDDVYKFYLIDVEMDESTVISYVKEGLNALQLYLQRCRMRAEYYVKRVDIKEAWWSWILNYREWEANRKIFAYPENYLLPSLRSSRTKLFRDMESALLQTDISKGYVEEQYCRYLDEFAELSQVTPVELYFTEDSCYLFGRSNEQAGTFYYCEQKNGEAYGEWKKIEVLIQSDYVTPVFIFNRLYLFWVELKCVTENTVEGKSGDINSLSAAAYTASICCTSLNMQGKWIAARKLAEDELVYYDGEKDNPAAGLPFLQNVYDMEDISWKKVQVYCIPEPGSQKENLLLVYGRAVNDTGTEAIVSTPSGSGYQLQFCRHIYELGALYNQMLAANMTGHLTAGFSRMYNEELEPYAQNQYYVLDPYTPTKWNQAAIRPFISNFGNTAVGVVQSIGELANAQNRKAEEDTEFGEKALNQNSFTSENISAQQSQTIFRNLKAAGVITAANTVDKERLRCIDLWEVLLNCLIKGALTANMLPRIADILFQAAGGWCLLGNGEKQPEVIPAGNLAGGFLVNAGGESFYMYPGQTVLAVPEAGRPVVTRECFVTDGIDSRLSGEIYDLYKLYGIIGAAGSVNIDMLTGLDYSMLLGNLILQNKLTDEQAAQVNARLLTAPRPYRTKIDENPGRYRMSDSMYTGKMPVSQASFISLGNSRGVAVTCMTELKKAGIIDEDGFLTEGYREGKGLEEACKKALAVSYQPEIYHLLMGYPRIQENFFADGTVTPALSTEIVKEFRMYSIIDKVNCVNLKMLAVSSGMVLGNMVLRGKLAQSTVTEIYRKLFHAPSAVCVKYREKEDRTMLAPGLKYRMERMSNQSIKGLKKKVYTQGVDSLLKLETQEAPVIPVLPLGRLQPNYDTVMAPSALDGAQPDFKGLYGEYNWEIFYHMPMLIAEKLKSGFRNSEAAAWYAYIFQPSADERLLQEDTFAVSTNNRITPEQSGAVLTILKEKKLADKEGRVAGSIRPDTDLSFLKPEITEEQIIYVRNILLNYTCASPAGCYWNFKPFRSHTLQSIIEDLSSKEAIKQYNDEPFNPHGIAGLRIGAYEKYTFMEYIDNLIQWGDKEFTRFTWEAITTAAMLYVTAYSMLGKKPLPKAAGEGEPKNYRYFYEKYHGDIPQFLLEIENMLSGEQDADYEPNEEVKLEDVHLYFEIPENERLLGYWDIIEDRLYKIRNSMDIQGNKRSLKLYEAPLNPMDLVRAAAAENSAVMPFAGQSGDVLYHFPFLLERAKYYASVLAQTGSSLLAALEKSDGEGFALLTNTHEKLILDMTTALKKYQEEELKKNLESLENSKKAAEEREKYYTQLLETGISASELQSIDEAKTATNLNVSAQAIKTASAIGYAVPQVGSPFAMTYGGQQIGNVMTATAGVLDILSTLYGSYSQQTAVMAGYERRGAEWELQKSLAVYEKDSIDCQIEAANKRLDAARTEREIHQKLIVQKQEIYEYLNRKFTGRQLYQWMAGKLSGLMWQAYQMTLKLAYEAQQTYQTELDSEDSFITYQYWDSERKGLLSGEALLLSLNEMEMSYYKKNVRRFEIEKNISLRETAPDALTALKEKGECSFAFTEKMFDEDYPGHYVRKIKTLSVTIPAVIAPYETLKAVLTQTGSALVSKPDITAVKYLLNNCQGERGTGLLENWCANQKIAVSRGIEDNGMFFLNFQSEKYLPFEGTGAVSGWNLKMPQKSNKFDFGSIADVIINIKYTALEDGHLGGEVKELVWE